MKTNMLYNVIKYTKENSYYAFAAIGIVSILLASCAQTETDKIGEAQLCLDKATAATVSSCLDKVSGIESAGAYNIRCSAMFIQEGFSNGTKITQAFSSISGGTGGGNVLSLIGNLMFSYGNSISADHSNAAVAYNYCYKSGGKGALMLSTYTYLAMALQNYLVNQGVGSCSSTPTYNLATCMTGSAPAITAMGQALTVPAGNSNASTLQSTIGSALKTMYNVSCSGVGSNQSLCSQLSSAVSGASSDEQIFVNFIGLMCTTPLDGNCN